LYGTCPLHWLFVGSSWPSQSHQETMPGCFPTSSRCITEQSSSFGPLAVSCQIMKAFSTGLLGGTVRGSNLGRNKAFYQFDNVRTGSGPHSFR
jgi:hypothetical protein